MPDPQILIVGAGVAGLTCARELAQAGVAATVLERSRGVGGRCATRRIEGQPVDHGVPYLHGSDPAFVAEARGLVSENVRASWPERVLEPRLACQPGAFAEGSERWAIEPGLSALPKALANGLDVRLGADVAAIEPREAGWAAIGRDGTRHAARTLVLAASLAQSLRLLEPLAREAPALAAAAERLRRVQVLPVLTTIAGYALDAPAPEFDSWNPLESTMVQMLVHDSAKRRDPAWRVLVIHARPRFSVLRLEAPREEWSREILWEAGDLLGAWAASPAWAQGHRWSSGRVRVGDELEAPLVIRTREGAALIVAGDAFGGSPGVEGAWRSGRAAALAARAEADAVSGA